MNRRQTTILWILLTFLLPVGYFIASRGLQIEDRFIENKTIRGNGDQGTNAFKSYLVEAVQQGKTLTYELRADHFPTNDEEIVKLISTGRQLSEQEAKAWQEKDIIAKERKHFWECSAIGIFLLGSTSGLLLYRAKANSKDTSKKAVRC